MIPLKPWIQIIYPVKSQVRKNKPEIWREGGLTPLDTLTIKSILRGETKLKEGVK